ncbi:hypothetical protein ACSX1A_03130 [Pontibacter sp. MBLB2868]|uniref:hypothetical protein n=1 Tax=Pontibacter sp. MBLB2868 TaxID=3451555 RepID=UPI003F756E73
MKEQRFNPLHRLTATELLQRIRFFHAELEQKPEHASWPKELVVNDHNRDALLMICAYFTKDPVALEKYGMDPNKSLFVAGASGQGKTHFMTLIQKYMSRHCLDYSFAKKYAQDLLPRFEEAGTQAIVGFARIRNPKGKLVDVYYDDVLSERPGRHYGGPEVMYMAEVINERYILYKSHNLKTFFTSNERSERMREVYGEKVLGRIKDMCNIVVFPPEATNWRVVNSNTITAGA